MSERDDEYENQIAYRRFPKAPIERRVSAFLIDFIGVWLLTSMATGNIFLQFLVFVAAWFAARVIIVEKNQGQSLGTWCMDLKVIDLRDNKTPTLIDLARRELIVGFGAFLATLGLNINFLNPLSMLLLLTPLIIDCCIGLADDRLSQSFHDRFAKTTIIQTRRGFSLDLRLKKLYYQGKRYLRDRQRLDD
jgi:uncharacterized RDD family membrane protein YckC